MMMMIIWRPPFWLLVVLFDKAVIVTKTGK
jgi:hypothetical protein